MKLRTVTITGASDDTLVSEMVDLSTEFPFVEWGILVSASQEGTGRFPSRQWIKHFCAREARSKLPLRVSTHLCGRWVRELVRGHLDWLAVPEVLKISDRVQINTHGGPTPWTRDMIKCLDFLADKQIIFQWDGRNDHLAYVAFGAGKNVAALFDLSGGAGILPETWAPPEAVFPCGYAGGLGPDNVEEQLKRIAAVCDEPFWIDMERRVRSDDDGVLDMTKVRRVLQICAPYVDRPGQ